MAKVNVDGVLAVNKERGFTSTDVVRKLKGLTRAKKIGHAGTLDPLATGLLLICLGEATKIQRLLIDAGKEYRGVMELGKKTDTLDSDGTVVQERSIEGIGEEQIRALTDRFTGVIEQVPPMYSALKVEGERLYQKARRGEEVERSARRVHIKRLEITAIDLPKVSFVVETGRGAYVRTLVDDMGEALGCGAHLTALERSRIGSIILEKAVSISELNREDWQEHLLTSLEAVGHLPRLNVSEEGAERLLRGQELSVRDVVDPIPWTPGMSLAVTAGERLVAIGDAGAFPFLLLRKRMIHPGTTGRG